MLSATALRLTQIFLCLVLLTAATMHPIALGATVLAGAAAVITLAISLLRPIQ